MFSPRDHGRSRRGITLAEVIVVAAVLVIVVGVLLGILIETRNGSLRGQEEIAAADQARLILDEVRSVLEAGVPPGSLDSQITVAGQRFAGEHCSLVSSRNRSGNDFYLTTIETVRDKQTGQSRVELATSVLDSARTQVPREGRRSLGVEKAEFSSVVRFEYATTVDEFRGQLQPGEYPRVIQVRVRVEPVRKDREQAAARRVFELVTAVRML